MRTLYSILESIADDDNDIIDRYDNDSFPLSIARCFKKVFGDFDPNLKKQYGALQLATATFEVDSSDKDVAFEELTIKLKDLEKELKNLGYKSTSTVRKRWGSIRSEHRYLANNIEITKKISLFKKMTCVVNFDVFIKSSENKVSDPKSRAKKTVVIFAITSAPIMSECDKQVIEYLKDSKRI